MRLLLSALFLYVPTATISTMYYLGMVYISNFRYFVGIKSSSLSASALDIAEASTRIFLENWLVITGFLIFGFLASIAFAAMYMYSLANKGWLKKYSFFLKLICFYVLVSLFSLLPLLPLLFLEHVLGIAEGEATRIKKQINTPSMISKIVINDKVVAKGVIVGMSDAMVWIYDGKNTTGMQIGDHKIITPVPAKKEKTAN